MPGRAAHLKTLGNPAGMGFGRVSSCQNGIQGSHDWDFQVDVQNQMTVRRKTMGVEEFEFGGVNLRGLIWRTLLPVIIAIARLSRSLLRQI